MISPALEKLTGQKRLLLLILWSVFTASILVMGLLAYLVPPVISGPAALPVPQSVQIAIAVFLTLASLTMRRLFNTDIFLHRGLHTTKHTPDELARDPRSGRVDEAKRKQLELLTEDERRLYALHDPWILANVVNFALNEGVAVIGFLNAIMSRAGVTFLPYGIAALLLNALMFPDSQSFLERARRVIMDRSMGRITKS